MSPIAIASVIICAAAALLIWCLCRIAKREWIREEVQTEHSCPTEPNCPRCEWYRAEHGRFEFPNCLRCSSDGTTCPKCVPLEPKPPAPDIRCGCECACCLRLVEPDELATGTCAWCLDGDHFCDHGVSRGVECPACDAFHNVINLDSRRGNAS